mmetsp:Transcript_40519/g.101970  ORF Transcript_40519/g.101970 Transcript_40519/m.101970 type:complete len:831 (+) Transcript_40519:192-2684(+)
MSCESVAPPTDRSSEPSLSAAESCPPATCLTVVVSGTDSTPSCPSSPLSGSTHTITMSTRTTRFATFDDVSTVMTRASHTNLTPYTEEKAIYEHAQNVEVEEEDDDDDESDDEEDDEESEDSEDSEDDVPLAALLNKQAESNSAAKAEVAEGDGVDYDDISLEALQKMAVNRTDAAVAGVKKKRSSSSSSSSSSSKTSKKRAASSSSKSSKRKAPDTSSATKKEPTKRSRTAKKEESPAHRWWAEDSNRPKGHNWVTLRHSGVLFSAPYQPHNVPLIYDGKRIALTPLQEEFATYYAQYLSTQHVKNPRFNENFFKDWQLYLNEGGKHPVIRSMKKCDFSLIHAHVMEQREQRRNRSKEEKAAERVLRQDEMEKYGYAMVDGRREKMASFRVEPPGLFLGRGDHPLTGKIKRRSTPEDVILNLDKDAPVPPAPGGGSWKEIVHNPTVTWLAEYRDHISNHRKYVWLSASSRVKGQADMKKFETARKLRRKINKIRRQARKNMKSDDVRKRQLGVATWIIDKLALRVGNEKGEDEADTVGCCSLRVEHVSCIDDKAYKIRMDFLGKDSMRYLRDHIVDPLVYSNLKQMIADGDPKDPLFDRLNTTYLNNHLKTYMPGLTAKVFRTYNASQTLQDELSKTLPESLSVDEKVLEYNRANREVAILCNHQRSLPPKHNEQMEKLRATLAEVNADIKKCRHRKRKIEKGTFVPPAKPSRKKDDEKKDDEKEKKKDDEKEKKKGKTKKPDRFPTTVLRCEKMIERLQARVKKIETKLIEKDELKTIALGTSRLNYLDPRISIVWCRKNKVPISRIFTKTLRDKFSWALEVEDDWVF